MNANDIELYSPLPPAECVARLTSACDEEPSLRTPFEAIFGSCGSKPVLGRVTESSLRLRKRIDYRNSFQTGLTASIRPEGSGTIISGKFAMNPFVRVFMTIWFGGAILIGCFMFIGTIVTLFFDPTFLPPTDPHDNHWIGVIAPPLVFTALYGLACLGRYWAGRDARFLTEFLTQTLNANARNAS